MAKTQKILSDMVNRFEEYQRLKGLEKLLLDLPENPEQIDGCALISLKSYSKLLQAKLSILGNSPGRNL